MNHALKLLENADPSQRLFLFLNVSAIHGPNHYFVKGAAKDSVESQRAALRYVDGELGRLFDALRNRGKTFCMVFPIMVQLMGKTAMKDIVWRMR